MVKHREDVNFYKILTFLMCVGLIPYKINAINELHGFSPQNSTNRNSSETSENATRTKKQINIYHDEIRKEVRDFPFPPQNYGQYNSPITQKDISQMDFPFLDNGNTILTREIRIKQGRLKGLVRELKNKKLKEVEIYLGIPYAAPPVGPLRFMPPGSPPNWRNVRTFDTFGPVCPQVPPDLTHEPLKTMNAGRFNHLKGLLPFLRNQSEDCLYLNIYAPIQDPRSQIKYPVIVYIHGESFEWNSGNPYDGSILASYGKVVVVTINFRLGILGFLRPGISGHTVSNFGLLDQIAALQWVKDNIGEFGGDASSVTLMGHGTGAACINFLMVSPVSRASDGLFHKAILMSGTALSDWALTDNPWPYTIQVAEALNCPVVEENDELPNCLRRKRLSEIMAVKINAEEFKTPFGPLVDGSVVPNSPEVVMGHYKNLFTRYDMLYGMTEWESYHSLNAVSLAYGMLERERDQLLKNYMRSKYEVLPDLALARTLAMYTDTQRTMTRPAAEEHRDLVLDVLSDARITAPMIQMAIYHSSINPKSYLYIFQHKSEFGEFAESEKSISGEEIPYVFGVPLANGEGSLSHHTFSLKEQLLSEAILTYFTNFAKSSNPNLPRRSEYLTLGPREWQKYDAEWPRFEEKNQSYMALRIHPVIGHRYREQMVTHWNKFLPDVLSNPPLSSTRSKQPKEYLEPVHPPDDVFGVWANVPPRKSDSSLNFFNQPKFQPTQTYTYGTVIKSPIDHSQKNRHLKPNEKEKIGSGQMDHPIDEDLAQNRKVDTGVANSMALTFFVIIGACFLIINIFAFTLLYYKRKKLKMEETRLNQLSDDLDDGGFREREENRNRGCTGGIYDIVTGSKRSGLKGDEIYEAVKSRSKDRSRKCSTSTVDPHTKVREWIQHEIIEKYSPAFLHKMNRQIEGQEEISSTIDGFENEIFEPKQFLMKPILKQQSTETDYSVIGTLPKRAPKKNVQKVSIGIDATPATRSASVLKQTPIEITKSLDRGLLSAGSSPNSKKDSPSDENSLRRSRTSISLQMLPLQNEDEQPVTPLEPTVIKIHHHSKSEPAETIFQTFGNKKDPADINVTSRDSEIILTPENLPENTLRNIQKRNFPKVLPDLPLDSSKVAKRLSLPPCSHLVFTPSHEMNSTLTRNKVPPPPPPRISTLDRRHREKQVFQEEKEEPKTMTSSALINFKTPEATNTNMTNQKKLESEKKELEKQVELEKSKTEKKISPVRKISQIPVQKQNPKTIIIASNQNQGTGTLKRQEPNIIIQSVSGPKKADNKSKSVQKPTPHVNLQLEESKINTPATPKVYVRDSKGPSDKQVDKKSTGFEKIISSKPKKKEDNADEPPLKGIIKTNINSIDTEESSSSSSITKDSTGTVKKGKKPAKNS